ncbi:MAG: response regulator [Planctomycetota bacterium]|jgi:DNA-binding NarL/FixJ family response regulator
MVIIAVLNVLAVGMKDRTGEFEGLPVRLLDMAHGSDAICSFKTGSIDTVISHWNLIDMPDGEFLKKLKAVRPEMPTVAIIEPNNPQQEIEARMLGVNAVIPELACRMCGPSRQCMPSKSSRVHSQKTSSVFRMR